MRSYAMTSITLEALHDEISARKNILGQLTVDHGSLAFMTELYCARYNLLRLEQEIDRREMKKWLAAVNELIDDMIAQRQRYEVLLQRLAELNSTSGQGKARKVRKARKARKPVKWEFGGGDLY
jgi:hypothetical protein